MYAPFKWVGVPGSGIEYFGTCQRDFGETCIISACTYVFSNAREKIRAHEENRIATLGHGLDLRSAEGAFKFR